jgi:hypothetical protein
MKSEPIIIKHSILTVENNPIGCMAIPLPDHEIVFNEDYTRCWINDSTGRCIIKIKSIKVGEIIQQKKMELP